MSRVRLCCLASPGCRAQLLNRAPLQSLRPVVTARARRAGEFAGRGAGHTQLRSPTAIRRDEVERSIEWQNRNRTSSSSGATTSASSNLQLLQRRADGLPHAQHRPHRQRRACCFTDCYGEQSCTAGRASFITGQSGFRTGLTKVGIPAAPVGLQAEDPTIAELLKPLGYATGQFGKNHLGDRNEFLPTVHGFDEFFGNLYHLNAEEEPEMPDYPTAEGLSRTSARGSARAACCTAGRPTRTTRPRSRAGAGSASRRSRTPARSPRSGWRPATTSSSAAAKDFIKRQHEAGKPFFCWVNTTHMHLRTHTKPESLGQAGRWQSPYHDTMIDHDKNVGELLDLLDELGIADNTFVMYSTDNGPHMNTWPDGAMTPFRSEKNTNWEGAFRVPLLVRWPGQDPGGRRLQRDRPAPRLAADVPGDGRRAGHRREAARRGTRRRARPSRCTSTATTCCRT